MILLLFALLATVAPSLWVYAAAGLSHQLVIAPVDLQASLAISHDQSTSRWTVEASHGGILVVKTTSTTVPVPNVDLANLSSIQATWRSAGVPASPTFGRIFGAASPSLLPFLFSAGAHVRVATTSNDGTNGIIDADHLIRALLQAAPVPLQRLIPSALSEQDGAGVLAWSLCAATGFTRHETSERVACFSASFQYTNGEHLADLFPLHGPVAAASPLLAALVLRPSATEKSSLNVEVVTVSVTSLSVLESSAFSEVKALAPRFVVVKQVDSEKSMVSVLSVNDGRETPQRIPPVNASTAGDIVVAVLGEGFHRRVRIDIVTEKKICQADDTAQGKVLVVVPLSTSIYADLDELRRMERFGEVKLHAPAKHIEIERPTAVSSQHMIALEFPIDPTQHTHTMEFPIHLRYQSPSNSTFYAPALVVAPEIFVSCVGEVKNPPSSNDEPLDSLFSQWISDAAWESTKWRRVVPPSALATMAVPVPVGFTPHGPLVSAITFSVTGLGALVLVCVAWTTSTRPSKSPASMWKPKTT